MGFTKGCLLKMPLCAHNKGYVLMKDKKTGFLLFMFPALFVLVLVLTVPLGYSLLVSFFDTSLKVKGLGNFVGLGNYIAAAADVYFRTAAWTTVKFTAGVVIIEFIIGLFIALLLNTNVKLKNVFFTVIIIPMMITPIAVGLTWRLLLHSNLGIVNYILFCLGLPGRAWLADVKLALGTVMFIDIWQQIPYMVLVILAGLVTLPTEPYEAATIDGASWVQSFFRLTLPLMAPNFLVVLLLRTITALRTYDIIYVLTRGGPGTSTEVISYNIYQQAFRYTKIGMASAMSYLLLISIIPIAALFIYFSKDKTLG
jgi:multiple sugar transport system permease protein